MANFSGVAFVQFSKYKYSLYRNGHSVNTYVQEVFYIFRKWNLKGLLGQLVLLKASCLIMLHGISKMGVHVSKNIDQYS